MTAYYNEHNDEAAAWLRHLMCAGLIPWGDIDTRSIVDVSADDLKGYVQVHLFAGIGGWPYAARLASWPDDRPLWTGSCPCQPFSNAGKQKGEKDDRHLWPEMYRLIAARRPPVVVGEQVAGKLGREWLAGVRLGLGLLAYSFWAADLPAACVGSPHIRQRLWWLADANEGQRRWVTDPEGRVVDWSTSGRQQGDGVVEPRGVPGALADADGRFARHRKRTIRLGQHGQQPQNGCAGWVGDAGGERLSQRSIATDGRRTVRHEGAAVAPPSPESAWSRYDVVHCTDGKARRFEPGSFPLAHGVSGRVGLLRGYGNAITAPLAAKILEAYLKGP